MALQSLTEHDGASGRNFSVRKIFVLCNTISFLLQCDLTEPTAVFWNPSANGQIGTPSLKPHYASCVKTRKHQKYKRVNNMFVHNKRVRVGIWETKREII